MSETTNYTNEYLTLIILVNLAHVDERMDYQELKWLRNSIRSYPLTNEERDRVNLEIENPSHDYYSLFKLIDNFYVRSQIMMFAKYLFAVDGNFDETEKKAYHKLKQIHDELSVGVTADQQQTAHEIIKESKAYYLYQNLEQMGKEMSSSGYRSYSKLKWIILLLFIFVTVVFAVVRNQVLH